MRPSAAGAGATPTQLPSEPPAPPQKDIHGAANISGRRLVLIAGQAVCVGAGVFVDLAAKPSRADQGL